MSRYTLILFLIIVISLSGCSQASQLENHAYVLIMGLDQTEDHQMKMTVQIPKIASNAAATENAAESSGNYIKFSVTAENYEACLEKLDWASPRDLNLSQIKLIVLSQELARGSDCKALIEHIAQTERLYTASKITVCSGSAEEFVSAIQPKIGMRVSTDIDAMFEHYTSRGYVPESSLAELYYQSESIYSDPMVSFSMLEEEKNKSENGFKAATALAGDIQHVSSDYESEISTLLLGAAVFSNGTMKGTLNGKQTMLACLLRNEIEALHYECEGQMLTIVPARSVYIKIDTKTNPVRIQINAKLSIASQEGIPNEETLRNSFESDIFETINAARNLSVEPFGFAQRAARSFLTIDAWQQFDWKRHFKDAEIEVELRFARSDA